MSESRPMVFGATSACPACSLRFARRDACPSCGGAVLSLSDREGRAAIRGGARRGGGGLLVGLARFAPSRPWIPIAIGLAMALPAMASLVLSPSWLRETFALAGAGALFAGFSAAAWLGQRAMPPPAPKRKLRVHAGEPGGASVVSGVAKAATVEIESPLGGERCLVAGLRGDVDGEEVDDADGGDFDVVTPEGEIVMVSLEHACLEPVGDEALVELAAEEAAEIEPFLVERVGQRVRERCTLAETVVAAGDIVSVSGTLAGPAIAVEPFRGGSRGRVMAGTADRPLVVRLVKRGGAS